MVFYKHISIMSKIDVVKVLTVDEKNDDVEHMRDGGAGNNKKKIVKSNKGKKKSITTSGKAQLLTI